MGTELWAIMKKFIIDSYKSIFSNGHFKARENLCSGQPIM